ncbi:MAG: lysophospholipase, partial [Alphaproteobacteria bacterium]
QAAGTAAAAPRLALAPLPGVGLAETPDLYGEFVTGDGHALPMRAWIPPAGAPRAVILALHGFNDYGHAFAGPARRWAAAGIATYAYDQRGFGGAPERGLWAGQDALVGDLIAAARLVRARHPGAPFFLLGESMGGAVAMLGAAGIRAGEIRALAPAGLILVAPAVWGTRSMNLLQSGALWLAAHTVPWLTLSGRGLDIRPSDNIAMLRRLSADPLVIKESRVDAIYGMVRLMDSALSLAPRLGPPDLATPVLLLYGERDEIIPRHPVTRLIRALPEAPPARRRIAFYDTGFHMLLRDLRGATVIADIAAWIADPAAPLPSGNGPPDDDPSDDARP